MVQISGGCGDIPDKKQQKEVIIELYFIFFVYYQKINL